MSGKTDVVNDTIEKKEEVSVKGHRQRLRNEINDNGLMNQYEHRIVEYLLFHGIPMKDTRPIAYELINKFGSLYGISNAPVDVLMEIKGMTKNAAVFIHTIGDLSKLYLFESGEIGKLASVEEVLVFLRKIINPVTESCYFININAMGEMESVEEVAEGTENSLAIPVKTIAEAVVKSGAKKVILVHNHPSGAIDPSSEDRKYTFKIMHTLDMMGIELTDHLVIFDKDAYSMKNDKFYRHNWRLER